MNKLIKGAVTGAAGITLLLGGAGTFAAWNSQAQIAAGPVSTGTLSVAPTAGATATWTDITTGTPQTVSDPTTYKFAPGDTLKLVEDVTVTATGNNLVAALSALAPTLTDTATGTGAGSAASAFVVNTTFDTADETSLSGGATVAAGANNTYTFTTSTNQAGQVTIPIDVTISLPATAGNGTENATVNLTKIGIDLTQTSPATASPVATPAS